MPIVYKYRPGRGPITKDQNGEDIEIFERDLKSLYEDKIFVPTPKQLNDPTEGVFDDTVLSAGLGIFNKLVKGSTSRIEQVYSKVKEQLKTSGIYSLSKTATNELMWAYYANGHNGYAIMIDTDVLYKSLNGGTRFANIHAFDVKYVDSLPKIDFSIFNHTDSNETVQRFIGCKSKSWKHEQEYRLVLNHGGELKRIDYRAIRGFVFGYLMPQNDIEFIMDLFKGRHLAYSKIFLNPQNYQFYTVEIEDIYKDAPNYHPNNINCDFDAVIEDAKFYDDTIISHQKEAKEALEIVASEPFVDKINFLSLSENEQKQGTFIITINADYKNPLNFHPTKIFRFIVDKDGKVIRTD